MTSHLPRLPALLLLAGLAAGCTFARTTSNEVFRDLDANAIVIGKSTFRDVLNTLGTPSGASAERIGNGVPNMVTFRYNCLDQKQVSFLFSYLLKLPFQWSDKQTGHALIVEFTADGTVADLCEVGQSAVWMPFQSEATPHLRVLGRSEETSK